MDTIPYKEVQVSGFENPIVIALKDAQKAADDNLAQMTALLEKFLSSTKTFN